MDSFQLWICIGWIDWICLSGSCLDIVGLTICFHNNILLLSESESFMTIQVVEHTQTITPWNKVQNCTHSRNYCSSHHEIWTHQSSKSRSSIDPRNRLDLYNNFCFSRFGLLKMVLKLVCSRCFRAKIDLCLVLSPSLKINCCSVYIEGYTRPV